MSTRLSVLLCLAVLAVPCAQAASDPTDFAGVWQAFSSTAGNGRGTTVAVSSKGQALVKEAMAQYPNYLEPGSYCVPPGMPYSMMSMVSYPVEIEQSKGRITMLVELESQYRRIWMDGRAFPKDYPTTRMGYSVGHWEGDTLVIETRLLSEDLYNRQPRTENTVVTERISKIKRADVTTPPNAFINNPTIDDSVLSWQITVSDPVFYPKPESVTMYYQHIPDNDMLEYSCGQDMWQEAIDKANSK